VTSFRIISLTLAYVEHFDKAPMVGAARSVAGDMR